MSMSTTYYLGPYIKFLKEFVKGAEEIFGCSVCENVMDAQFCSKCGTKCSLFKRSKNQQKVDAWDLSDKIKERLYVMPDENNGPEIIFLPNVKVDGITRELSDHSEREEVEISSQTIANEIYAFQQFFKKELAIIGEAYAPQEVYVRWGFVTYWS